MTITQFERMKKLIQSRTIFWIFFIFLIGNTTSGCSSSVTNDQDLAVQAFVNTPNPTYWIQETETATPTSESAPDRTIWLDPLLPEYISDSLDLPAGWQLIDGKETSITIRYGEGNLVSQWILALVAPFPTLTDDVSASELQNYWQENSTGNLEGKTLFLSENVSHALTLLWGETSNSLIQMMDEDDLLQTAWDSFDYAIVPFDTLEPKWKVLSIDGESPIHNDFNKDNYALTIPVSLQGNQNAIELLLSDEKENGNTLVTASNRDTSKLTVLAMTGVTALARSTAYTMEQKGITYPGEEVRDVLASADITHISNEVAFANNCPVPQANRTGLMFCSNPEYIQLLEYIGTDIVEFTGDHLADWGRKAIYLTLEMYQEEGWLVYGGGINEEEGKKAVLIENNGNRLAFIGCNAKGSAFATATDEEPGAVVCDFPYLYSEIERLANLGYLPIVSIQHNEYDLYKAQEVQERDFRRLANSGAIIISGSQSHQPQGMEFYGESFLHYGLGNLFFDQYKVGVPERQGTIDKHVFYDNRYISTEIITTYLIDYARPTILNGEDREDLLKILFTASGWQKFRVNK